MTPQEFAQATAEEQRKIINGIIKPYSTHSASDRRLLSKHNRISLYFDYEGGLYSAYDIAMRADDIITSRLEDQTEDDLLPPVPVTHPAPVTPATLPEDEAQRKLDALNVLLNGNKAEIDTDKVKEIAEAAAAAAVKRATLPKQIQVIIPDIAPLPPATHHYLYPKVVQLAAMRENVMLVGGAGSGKTTTAINVAKALELEFYSTACCLQTTKTDFFGYCSITTGDFVATDFYRAYTAGGVFLLDEIDSCNPAVLLAINGAIENGFGTFANGRKPQHKDFVCIACGNTFGGGADKDYTGRTRQDKATFDRFIKLEYHYDEELERSIALSINPKCDSYVTLVQNIRQAAADLKINILVSPRTSIKGAKLLLAGWTEKEALSVLCFAGLDKDTVNKITSKAA